MAALQDAAGAAAPHEGALPTGLEGFHPLNAGINFRDAYRWGLHGTFLRFTQVRASPVLQLHWQFQAFAEMPAVLRMGPAWHLSAQARRAILSHARDTKINVGMPAQQCLSRLCLL